jgi:PKD repeat protein
MTTANVFVAYANVGGTCNENNPNCPANQNITFTASAVSFGASGYNFGCANHTFNWTIDGQPKSGQSVVHAFTSSGPKVVSLTVSNGSQQFTTGANINVTGGSGPPPPPPPPPPPTGGCGTMTASNVFITFSTLGGTCNENNPTNCPANQEIVFVAGASSFGTGGYSFACANHSFNWTIDGQQKSGQSVGHTFTSQGQKSVNLSISNGIQTFPVSATLVVGPGGNPVTPDFTVTIGKSLLVPGTSIYKFEPIIDPVEAKASIHTYAWNFGDGKPVLEVRTSDPVFHEYIPACPSCDVTLTVYDSLNRPLATTTEPLSPSRRRSARH